MAYDDEFRTDGFENEHAEQTCGFVEHEEFLYLEEMEGLEQDELVIYGLEYVGEEEVELVPIEDQDLLDEV